MRRERWLAVGVMGALALGSTGCGSWKRGGSVTDRMACWFKDSCVVHVPCETVRHDWPASEDDAYVAEQERQGYPLLVGRFIAGDGKPLPRLEYEVMSASGIDGMAGCWVEGVLNVSKDGYFRAIPTSRHKTYVLIAINGGGYHPTGVYFEKDTCVEIQLEPYKR
ncbi:MULTISPECIES: hypothetical protein [Corallococcus]|nr:MULTISPECIES: hypothetical protein [Corallococcus]